MSLSYRTAKLPCVLIRGHGKSVAYEAGDTTDKVKQLYNIWNAVYVDGDWRLVVPLWACQGIIGHSSGKYTLVETHDPKWQLIKNPYTMGKFCNIPHLKPNYFRYNVEIKSEFTCRYHAIDGKCHLSFYAKNEKWEGAFEYKLYYNHVESKGSISDDLQLDKYVIMERSGNQSWKFIIRFPVAGVYKMEIYGGPDPKTLSSICNFKLFCDTAMENVRQLPCDPGLIGFGPTTKLESVGLTSPSQTGGIILIHRHQEINFNFIMKRKVSIRTELVNNEMNSQILQQYIQPQNN
ncbi:hypothetical protein KUTeg_017939 [Tegillarca granosa]|uniref:KY-like immunoglobulin-like domain-containing protein n=1 Tax=Tegillarca granosa TaxID=220873 RepID=A0ABQ9EGF9_TEGGR|nr:hypothetical protein KUTeg_017939 [Tegillarca granosa]